MAEESAMDVVGIFSLEADSDSDSPGRVTTLESIEGIAERSLGLDATLLSMACCTGIVA